MRRPHLLSAPPHSRSGHRGDPGAGILDLQRTDPRVADQGTVNSCAAWAIAYGMLGCFAGSQGHAGAPFAPMYAYSQLTTPRDTGASPASVLDLLRTQGIDTTVKYAPGHGGSYWSYFDWRRRPTIVEKSAAATNKITGWVTLYNTFGAPGATAVAKLKQTLASGRPVALTIGVFGRFEWATGSGVISSAGKLGPMLGLHEVLAVGYDSRGVKIMNSWGTSWGNAGYGILDWNYVSSYSYEAETAAGFVTTAAACRPTIAAMAPATGSVQGGKNATITGSNLANAIVSIGAQSVVPSTVPPITSTSRSARRAAALDWPASGSARRSAPRSGAELQVPHVADSGPPGACHPCGSMPPGTSACGS